MSLYTRALNLVHRLTGRDAAALRYQRDAHAEEAGRERQRRMAAERDRDDWREHSARGWEERNIHVARGNEYLRQKNEQHVLADARGETIWKLQNRLTRWQRRYRRATVALHTWKPEAQAWKARAEEYEQQCAAAQRERDMLRRELGRAEADVATFQGEAYHASANADIVSDRLAAAERERDEARAARDALEEAHVALIETYEGTTGDVREAEERCASFGYSLPLRELAGRLLASERVNPLRRDLRAAGRERDTAVALLQRLVTARDEHALADAATWLHARTPARMATEQEGSRGGLAWMPGEALPDE